MTSNSNGDETCTGASTGASSSLMRVAFASLIALSVASLDGSPTRAQPAPPAASPAASAISLEDLYGATITAKQNFVGKFRNDLGEAPGGFSVRFDIRLGPDQTIEWTVTHDRYVDTPKGRKTGHLQRKGKGVLAKPGEARDGSGAGVWLFDGSTLTALRTFEVGGSKTDIVFSSAANGPTCEMTSPLMQQRGAGATKDTSGMQGGGKVEVIWSRMTTSTCRVVLKPW